MPTTIECERVWTYGAQMDTLYIPYWSEREEKAAQRALGFRIPDCGRAGGGLKTAPDVVQTLGLPDTAGLKACTTTFLM